MPWFLGPQFLSLGCGKPSIGTSLGQAQTHKHHTRGARQTQRSPPWQADGMAGQHWPPSWGTGTLLSFVYTCGEKRIGSGGRLSDGSLEIKEKESLILREVSEGKIKPWISEQVSEERGVYFGGEDAGSLCMRGLPSFTREALISAWELLFLPVVLGTWSPYLVHLRGKFIL